VGARPRVRGWRCGAWCMFRVSASGRDGLHARSSRIFPATRTVALQCPAGVGAGLEHVQVWSVDVLRRFGAMLGCGGCGCAGQRWSVWRARGILTSMVEVKFDLCSDSRPPLFELVTWLAISKAISAHGYSSRSPRPSERRSAVAQSPLISLISHLPSEGAVSRACSCTPRHAPGAATA